MSKLYEDLHSQFPTFRCQSEFEYAQVTILIGTLNNF